MTQKDNSLEAQLIETRKQLCKVYYQRLELITFPFLPPEYATFEAAYLDPDAPGLQHSFRMSPPNVLKDKIREGCELEDLIYIARGYVEAVGNAIPKTDLCWGWATYSDPQVKALDYRVTVNYIFNENNLTIIPVPRGW